MGELCNAILAGLVSITAGCDGVTDWGALLIGFIGAFWYILGKKMLYIFGVDDAIGAFPVHGACGAWGVLATGLFNVEVGAFYRVVLLKGQIQGENPVLWSKVLTQNPVFGQKARSFF